MLIGTVTGSFCSRCILPFIICSIVPGLFLTVTVKLPLSMNEVNSEAWQMD
jgi:hypothetical protein